MKLIGLRGTKKLGSGSVMHFSLNRSHLLRLRCFQDTTRRNEGWNIRVYHRPCIPTKLFLSFSSYTTLRSTWLYRVYAASRHYTTSLYQCKRNGEQKLKKQGYPSVLWLTKHNKRLQNTGRLYKKRWRHWGQLCNHRVP